MRRRGVTVLIGAVLLIALSLGLTQFTVPYAEMGPGPTVDTLGTTDGKPVISISGTAASKSQGQLRLVTISVQPDLTLFQAIQGWIAHDDAVVPKELLYPPDQSEKDVDAQNAQEFQQSQTSAETSALRALGYPVQVTVTDVAAGFDAASSLAKGDVITQVDGTAITSAQKLTELVRGKPAGTARQVTFTRAGQTKTVTITSKKADDGTPRLGVSIQQDQPHPFTIKIDLDKIGGPSAGLMFTLGIIDTIKPEDLTGGKVIAGTGTIDDDGNVGAIGGIPQKLVAAKRDKAKFFLTPAANCAEAMANPQPGLPLIKVATLDDALKALDTLRAGQVPPLCAR